MVSTIRVEPWSGDADVAAATINAGFQDAPQTTESAEGVRQRQSQGYADPDASFVAWDGEKPVGLMLGTFRSDGRAWAHAVTVIPEYRGRGLARAILGRFLENADARGVVAVHGEVLANNEAALTLYKTFGFVVGRRFSTFSGTVTSSPWDDLVHGGAELLPPEDTRPPRPLHRDRIAIARIPSAQVTMDRPSGAHVIVVGEKILDVGGTIDDVIVPRLLQSLKSAQYILADVPNDDPLIRLLKKLQWTVRAREVEVVRRALADG